MPGRLTGGRSSDRYDLALGYLQCRVIDDEGTEILAARGSKLDLDVRSASGRVAGRHRRDPHGGIEELRLAKRRASVCERAVRRRVVAVRDRFQKSAYQRLRRR